jgi:hypothetical protein
VAEKPRSSPLEHTWTVVQTIGPVLSHGGAKSWYLCLCREAIVAVPLGLWKTLKIGAAGATGRIATLQAAMQRPAEVTGHRELEDNGDPSWRRYPISELKAISPKRPFLGLFGFPEIRIHRNEERKPDIYGLHASQVKEARRYLFTLYEGIYSDIGYKKTPQKISLSDVAGGTP